MLDHISRAETFGMDKEDLLQRALQAREHAHAPYSRLKVGAALLTEGGEVVSGCNVENASFGLTVCAERAAVFSAVSQGHRRFRAIAIFAFPDAFTPSLDVKPVPPCGACRQVMAEFMDDDALVILSRGENHRLGDLLPNAFRIPSSGM